MSPVSVVTGAAGFIGSHMVDLLIARGHEVRGIDNLRGGHVRNIEHHRENTRFSFHNADITNLEEHAGVFEGAAYVFHFGGIGDIVPSIQQPLDYIRANIVGTAATLDAARRAGVQKFVYAASSSCYGDDPPVPTDEGAAIQTAHPYALSKYLAEQEVLHWNRVYKLPVVSIRMFNVYGPRVRTTGAYGAVFGVFLAQRANGKPLTIVGDGTQSRDFVYVTDVARAFLLAAESPHSGVILNCGAGNPQTILRLAELIGGDRVFVPHRPGEPACTWAKIDRIQSVLGWTPQVGFDQGVATMLDSLDAWKAAPVWDPASIDRATKNWFESLKK